MRNRRTADVRANELNGGVGGPGGGGSVSGPAGGPAGGGSAGGGSAGGGSAGGGPAGGEVSADSELASESLLRIRGLTRTFGDVLALDAVDLDIRPNEFFALLGPSGCGKTTLLRILAGFEAPDRGDVRLADRDLLALPPHRRPVNLMFQNYALFPHLTVRQNVAFGLQRERLPRAEIRQRVDAVLATVGLADEHRRRPAQLSGGQRQRVALARAIVKQPKLLLLDEPLSALDRKVRSEMQYELKRLQHEVGITFVVVTHDQGEALSLADRVAVLSEGRVRQVADPVTLYERPVDVFVASFVGDTNLLAGCWRPGGFEAAGLGRVPAPWPGHEIAAVPGHAWLSVRPERLTLGPPGLGVADGRVVDVQYVGGMTTVAVQVAGRAVPLLARTAGPPGLRRDQSASVSWRADDAVLLDAETGEVASGRPASGVASGDPTGGAEPGEVASGRQPSDDRPVSSGSPAGRGKDVSGNGSASAPDSTGLENDQDPEGESRSVAEIDLRSEAEKRHSSAASQ